MAALKNITEPSTREGGNKQFVRRILHLNLINYTPKYISLYCVTYSNISEADYGQGAGQTADEESPVRMNHHVRWRTDRNATSQGRILHVNLHNGGVEWKLYWNTTYNCVWKWS